MEKLTFYVLMVLWGGPFWLNACLPSVQIWADQCIVKWLRKLDKSVFFWPSPRPNRLLPEKKKLKQFFDQMEAKKLETIF